MGVNRVILVGNVGTKPELRYVGDRAVATFRMATNEPPRRTPQGHEVPERTEWHNIVIWDKGAEIAEKYFAAGTKLYIEGRLRTRQYKDRNAIVRDRTEIVVDHFDIVSRNTAPSPGDNNNNSSFG